jgi:hypothetical protein
MQKYTLFQLAGRANARSRDKITYIEADYELISAKLIRPEPNIRQYEIGRTMPPLAVQSYIRIIAADPLQIAKIFAAA